MTQEPVHRFVSQINLLFPSSFMTQVYTESHLPKHFSMEIVKTPQYQKYTRTHTHTLTHTQTHTHTHTHNTHTDIYIYIYIYVCNQMVLSACFSF